MYQSRWPSGRSSAAALLLFAAPMLAAMPDSLLGQEPSDSDGVGARGGEALLVDYAAFRPVRPPAGYLAAVQRGTRNEDGTPGAGYWQQRVDYRLDATIDPETAILEGTGTIRYTNNAPEELPALVMRLYQNVFGPGVQRNRTVELTGGMELRSVTFDGQTLPRLGLEDVVPGQPLPTGFLANGTLVQLFLPAAIATGATAELTAEWAYRIPGESAFRTGHIENRFYNVAQWYPQIAVYDDVRGFDLTPYLGDGEFYNEYGDFEVTVTAPAGWLVAATGVLQNPDEVLPAAVSARLETAVASDSVLRITDASELAAEATDGAARTWRYRAENVRDFAFAVSDSYVWDAVGAMINAEGDRIPVHAFYDPEIEHWSLAALYSKSAIEFFSAYVFPYEYPHVTAVYGPVGGMEYPMMVFIGRSAPGEPLFAVLAHELSHQWFPMVVGSPEATYAWMDEGLSTFNESLSRGYFFGNQLSRLQDQQAYLEAARAEAEAPLMQHTDHVESGFGRSVAAYTKPATILHAMRRAIGGSRFDAAYRAYATAWKYRHPYPWDFFAMMEAGTGEDLDWLWQAWFYETGTLDQAIQDVALGDGSLRIVIANRGAALMPIEIGIEFADGTTEKVEVPVGEWAGTTTITRDIPVDREVARVIIDPEQYYPDIDRSNNVWPEDDI